jgi:hypothetical protein
MENGTHTHTRTKNMCAYVHYITSDCTSPGNEWIGKTKMYGDNFHCVTMESKSIIAQNDLTMHKLAFAAGLIFFSMLCLMTKQKE